MIDSSLERRVKDRIKIDGRMTYRKGDSDEILEAELEDLSNRGARIWIQEELATGSQLHCWVDSEEPEQTEIEFILTLLHQLPANKESVYGYGCELEAISLLD